MKGVEMISKELLSEVLEKDAYPYDYAQNGRVLRYAFFESINRKRYINIYELAHKCKEWASKKGYIVIEYPLCVQVHKENDDDFKKIIGDKTTQWFTPKRCFDACKWILENTK